MRSLPVALAISNVFLTVHGVDGEDAAGQAERFDQGLDGWDLVRLLLDDFMGQDDPMIDGESAQHMRRLSVREGIKAAPERLAVDCDETPVPVRPRRAPGGCRAPTCRLAPAATPHPGRLRSEGRAAGRSKYGSADTSARRSPSPGSKTGSRRPARTSSLRRVGDREWWPGR